MIALSRRWVSAVAWLAVAAQCDALSMPVAPVSGDVVGAVQPQANLPSIDAVASLFNRTDRAIIDPFKATTNTTRLASTNTPSPSPTSSRSPSPTNPRSPSPTNSRSPSPTNSRSPSPPPTLVTSVPTPEPTPERTPQPPPPSTTDSTSSRENDDGLTPEEGTAASSSSSSMASHERVGPTSRRQPVTTSPTPLPAIDEVETTSPSPSTKRNNVIEFDVVTTKPPTTSPPTSNDNTANTNPQNPPVTAAPPPPAAAPTPPTAAPAQPTAVTTPTATSKPPSSSSPSPLPATTTAAVTTTPPQAPDRSAVGPTSKTTQDVPLSVKSGKNGTSSMSGDTAVGHNTTSGSSTGSSQETSTASSSSKYSLGAASIMSIVGVILGICVIVGLFVVISRRKYDDDDDDVDVLAYGIQKPGRPSIVRLSPTFLMNGVGAPAPGHPVEPDFGSLSPQHVMPSNRGRRPTGAIPVESPAVMEQSPRGTSGEGGPSPSAFDSTDDLSALDTRSSDGWSSVMESEFDQRSASRCTRDTRFTNLTISQHYSEYNPSDVITRTNSNRQMARRTNSSRFYNASEASGGGHASREFDVDDDQSSMLSFNVDQPSRETDASTFSDYRSTNQSYLSGRYTGDSHINF